MLLSTLVVAFGAFIAGVSAHYTFPFLTIGSTVTGEYQYVRETDNHWSNGPVTDMTDPNLRCYNSQNLNVASTMTVAAGSAVGFQADGTIIHPGVLNVYMAKAPGNVSAFDGSGNVWFKVYQIIAVTDGGTSITFPSTGGTGYTFTLPKSLPTGQYLLRIEHIALHGASTFGGAQFYIGCAQINVTGGGSGKPGPLVAIPGVYTGNEPGILINIYYPIPTSYVQPGPAVWTG